MRREYLPKSALRAWSDLNDITLNGVAIDQVSNTRGLGVVARATEPGHGNLLMTVPPHLVLSLENVWIYAKSDKNLNDVLIAVGEYSQTPRGAILIFLLMQITHNALAGSEKIGILNPMTEYVKFLPSEVPLPTFWLEEERTLLAGTSLEAALDSKMKSLDREFVHLYESTVSIDWCKKHWWNPEIGILTFDDWKQVDAMYRSRALDLPGTGHAMVPCIDMANHASGNATVALYDTDLDGNAILVLQEDKTLEIGNEVTITYGDEKGACEMLFSYGFLEETMTSARELFLDLEIPDDDPLKMAKRAVAKSPPGFKIFETESLTSWEGDFVWFICVNEEDGLDFRVLQTLDGKKELKVFWKDDEISDMSKFRLLLEKEQYWNVFHLRAVAILQGRLEQQLLALEQSKESIRTVTFVTDNTKVSCQTIMRLRDLEEKLMLQAYEDFEDRVCFQGRISQDIPLTLLSQKSELLETKVVQEYLGLSDGNENPPSEDDFS